MFIPMILLLFLTTKGKKKKKVDDKSQLKNNLFSLNILKQKILSKI